MEAAFKHEINEANNAAMDHECGPFAASYHRGHWFPTDRFRAFVQSERKFKWTLNTGVISLTLKHSVAAGGGEVWTAGHGTYKQSTNTLVLDNDTGHYQTSLESLERARTGWESMGYNVVFEERKDYAAALRKLAF
jgi:hypothetical protein